ncbi:response regulator transcription factor [Anaerovorax odorimutans]|uniref:Stage 0 sporulation protein A homolog n=1 Tax=Anaerovorax odorimutans TaxID=109327 RepID=A0ABT1RSP0_9FIRM|nr:response regulator transcription factor [Anaerovorax odorimutans]MCQ4638218.1 response regulator transcription factor [Anaerovorax odorimutans]
MQKKILIADDEYDLVEMLKDFFLERGYRVLTAYDGEQAVRETEKKPDLILLDMNMPEADGFSVCEKIRPFLSCPILFLTAKDDDMDKVRGFAAGGDDYILKPFSLAELEARVAAHLRREERAGGRTEVSFAGDLSIDYGKHKIFYKGNSLPFAKKDFAIIELLSQNPRLVFDKETIYERIWGYDSEGSSSVVAEHVRKIRRICADYGCGQMIETVWGVGYKWME